MNLNDTPAANYDADFALWLEAQLLLLRKREFDKLDLDNLLEEVGGLLRSQHRELKHRLTIIIAHLLKSQFQPARKGRSWLSTLSTQRQELDDLFDMSPSLRRCVQDHANQAYSSAVRLASQEMGMRPHQLPARLPYTEQQLLDPDFIP